MKSRIFTPSEQGALERRMNGDKKDPNGTYSGRVKPKLQELRDFFRTQYKDVILLLEDDEE